MERLKGVQKVRPSRHPVATGLLCPSLRGRRKMRSKLEAAGHVIWLREYESARGYAVPQTKIGQVPTSGKGMKQIVTNGILKFDESDKNFYPQRRSLERRSKRC